MVLVEVTRGDVRDGGVESVPVHWRVADAAGLRAVADADQPPEPRDLNAAADAGRRYHGWAAMAFVVAGDRVAVRCRLGPELVGRFVGRVAGGGPAPTDVRVPQPPGVGAVRPTAPVVPELELRAARRP